jgi:transcriptional regulator with GAF, ATPase, and Fis domain
VYELVESVAKSDFTVLIEGESGTGKELVAEAIHYNSPRKGHPIIKMSCSVFPESLMEDELFGHIRGAFTDARSDKAGRFELAHEGTLFIDDIDDLKPTAQVKLLRVLQEGTFERIGDPQTKKVDVRLLAATKRDLWDMAQEKLFREDLYFRLNVVRIRIPPLRERGEDIPLLVEHFIRKHSQGRSYSVEPQVLQDLQAYAWPGNVRELESAVKRAIALAGSNGTLAREHLLMPVSMPGSQIFPTGPLAALKDIVAEAEVRHIRSVLKVVGGHRTEASRILGITPKNLWEKMKKYAIEG